MQVQSLSRFIWLITAGSLVGCTDAVPTGGGLNPPAASLDIISGNEQSAPPGSELRDPLVARVTDGSGNPVGGQIVNFRVTRGGGSVFAGTGITNSRGIAQERWTMGPAEGSAQELEVRAVNAETGAAMVFATFRATAITASPAQVATVSVSPTSASLAVGATTQLSATTRDANGNTLSGRVVTWSSSNAGVARVSASGVVTGVAAGSATITATSEERSGSASITVTAPAPPPASGTVIFQEGFESGTLSAWDDRGVPGNHRVVNNAALARTGNHVLEFAYPQGSNGGGFLTKFFMPGYDSVLVSFWNRYPDNWQSGGYLVGLFGSRVDNQWSAFGRAAVCPNGTDFFNAFLYTEYGGNPGPTSFYTYHPDMQTGGCYGDTGSGRATYSATRTLTRGQWHRVDFWVRMNTPGQRNGVQRMWIDGELVGEWTGMRFRDSNDLRLNAVMISAHQSMGAPQSQVRHVDDIVVTANAASPTGGATPPPASPAQVATVSVSPTSASLAVGATTQLSATTRDASGNTLSGRVVTWSSSNAGVARVSASGVVTGVAAGSATITATSEGRSGSASITVTAPAPPPSNTGFSNEPAGFTLITDTDWPHAPQVFGSTAARIGSDPVWSARSTNERGTNSRVELIEDATAPNNSKRVLSFIFPAGFPGGYSPGKAYPYNNGVGIPGGPYSEVYMGLWWKASPNWQNHGSNINKLWFWAGPNRSWLGTTTWHWGGRLNGSQIQEILPLVAEDGRGYSLFNGAATDRVVPVAGQWYKIEWHQWANSGAGTNDGGVRVWVDGKLQMEYRNLNIPHTGFSEVYLDPTWGGIGGAKAAADQFYFARARVSVKR